jgi:catechol 2,3-dioxygenase-like lactoylglutathione lyase family enzyme
MFDDPSLPVGTLSLQLAFRVAPSEVATCAETLKERGVSIISGPTDRPFGHRTLFFRDPDGNVLEIYAEIE